MTGKDGLQINSIAGRIGLICGVILIVVAIIQILFGAPIVLIIFEVLGAVLIIAVSAIMLQRGRRGV